MTSLYRTLLTQAGFTSRVGAPAIMVFRCATFSSASLSLSCSSASCEAASGCSSSPAQQVRLCPQVHAVQFLALTLLVVSLPGSDSHLLLMKSKSLTRTLRSRCACCRALLRQRLDLLSQAGQSLLGSFQVDLLILQHLHLTICLGEEPLLFFYNRS